MRVFWDGNEVSNLRIPNKGKDVERVSERIDTFCELTADEIGVDKTTGEYLVTPKAIRHAVSNEIGSSLQV